MDPLIEPQQISQLPGSVVIIDARSGADARQRYESGHYPKAVHIDLDLDLSQKHENAANGGRHPLPSIEKFARVLGENGVSQSTTVVIYDDKSGANAAARLWWMMRAVGHRNVVVVNGGLDAIIRHGIKLETGNATRNKVAPYPVTTWLLPTVSLGEVEVAASDPKQIVVDVREAYRYRGEKEPIDLVAGHIPGAINVPYIDNLKPDGTFKDADELKTLYEGVFKNVSSKDVVVHCGSGVTACHTLLALEHAGFPIARLYVGSWSEWSRNDKPIATDS